MVEDGERPRAPSPTPKRARVRGAHDAPHVEQDRPVRVDAVVDRETQLAVEDVVQLLLLLVSECPAVRGCGFAGA